jgi:hypothetical protein
MEAITLHETLSGQCEKKGADDNYRLENSESKEGKVQLQHFALYLFN